MENKNNDPLNLSKSSLKTLLFLIAFGALLVTAPQWLGKVGWVLNLILSILTPFILGSGIAFVLNVPMKFIESKLFSGKGKKLPKGLRRVLSLTITLLLFILILLILGFIVIPQLAVTIAGLGATIQNSFDDFLVWGKQIFSDNQDVLNILNNISLDWEEIDWKATIESIFNFLKNGAGNMISSTITAAKGVISVITKIVISIVFAIYILLQKEKLGTQSKMALYAFAPRKVADRVMYIASISYKIFTSFITGQCIEALILGSLFFVVMSILRMPYALLISCLISVTALIPIVGAFIGCIVGAFLILMNSPTQALVFVITFLILQQIEGNLIYPHVVGSSVGLPSIWVLVAVTLGGNLMGILGMLLFIPLLSVLYTLFRETVHQRLEKRKIKI